jgi:uncharacterized protein (DUF1778 family)
MSSNPRPLWERQPYDTNESWPFFKAYRDLQGGARSLRRVRMSSGGMATTLAELKGWYDAHNWKERVAAYDTHMDAILSEEKETLLKHAAKESTTEHLELLQDAAELAKRELEKLLQASRETAAHGLLKPAELVKLMETAIKLGRLVNDKPTEVVEERTNLDNLTPEELLQLHALTKKASEDE